MPDIRTVKVTLPIIQTTLVTAPINGSFTASHNADVLITTTPTAVPFDTNNFDSGGSIDHDVATNNTRFVVNKTGTYEFIFQPQVSAVNNNNVGFAFIWLRKNGTTPIASSTTTFKVNHATSTGILVTSIIISLVANDYIELLTQASNDGEYMLDYVAGSGAGATARPALPACIVSVKGW